VRGADNRAGIAYLRPPVPVRMLRFSFTAIRMECSGSPVSQPLGCTGPPSLPFITDRVWHEPGSVTMKTVANVARAFWSDEAGQGLVEYALIIALVAVGLIAILLVLRNSIGNVFNNAATQLNNAPTNPYP
jgi:pilus assembly protein Flp/PilA